MNKVEKGFYVHYKGGIYFVQGIAANGDTHDWNDQLVIYETVDCAGEPDTVTGTGLMRFRTVDDFTKMIDPVTGADSTSATAISRFQRILGWHRGCPLVKNPDGINPPVVFVSQAKSKEN